MKPRQQQLYPMLPCGVLAFSNKQSNQMTHKHICASSKTKYNYEHLSSLRYKLGFTFSPSVFLRGDRIDEIGSNIILLLGQMVSIIYVELIYRPSSQDPQHSCLNIFFMLEKYQTHSAMEILHLFLKKEKHRLF